jgi:hypothetical protein
MEDLHDENIRARLRLIWNDPHKLDPARQSARVTREVAARVASVSKYLEALRDAKGRPLHDPEQVALFLMRCLFTMFAEDIELLPRGSFRTVLDKCRKEPKLFQRLVSQLWEAMDTGGFAYALEMDVMRFNGKLFKDRRVFDLPAEEIGELFEAARADWRQVEPAIFGTLLEQALDPNERRKLGAHYTPRAYVEQVVEATLIAPLRDEWDNVWTAADGLRTAGDEKAAIKHVTDFQKKLRETIVLDPACGTGNFLYVSLELMKRLEGEVLDALASLGEQMFNEVDSITPRQFVGIEINPRAAAITELVLWIGYLQWWFRTHSGKPDQPIMQDYGTIHVKDAVLAWTAKELRRDDKGRPVTAQDAQGRAVETYVYRGPKCPEWPAADYIVGNPPFVGGKDIRARMGDDYAEALWSAHPKMNDSADFVMYWWDRAADLLTRKGTRLKRFGFVTTNSITQVFQRRVIERHMRAKEPVSLVMAIADHPWTKATADAAAVRIAMSVVEAGERDGLLREVVSESGLDSDEPRIVFRDQNGRINPDFSCGVDVTNAPKLFANDFVCSRGVVLHGAGFIQPRKNLEFMLRGPMADLLIKPYRNGRDLMGANRDVFVLDLFGADIEEVRKKAPSIYQHLLEHLKPERASNPRAYRRDKWWLFGENVPEFRRALEGLSRYIATVETAKHRVFQFLDASILPDNMLVCIATHDAYHLGVISSYVHRVWVGANAASIGVYKGDVRYTKSRCFDPFPFPDATDAQIKRIRAVAEDLDAHRKQVQADHPGLTLTQLYNVLEKVRAGAALTPEDESIKDRGLVLILRELHDELDGLVAGAYGWPADLSDEEIIGLLVALNAQRAKEEKRGLVRWLRPAYQKARAGVVDAQGATEADAQVILLIPPDAASQKPAFPADPVARTAAVYDALLAAQGFTDARSIAARFRQGGRVEPAIASILNTLVRVGRVASDGTRYLIRRAA